MDVMNWALGAEIGQRVVYTHRNRADIEFNMGRPPLISAMRAHFAGLVFLAQRRRKDGFDYEATRISAPVAKLLKLQGAGGER